jgi:thiol-disulfide isomerase/thioredoxin
MRSSRASQFAAAALVAGLVFATLSGCGAPIRTGSALSGTQIGDMTLTGLDGNPVQFRKIVDGRVALVDLWATWCAPCLAAVPELQALHNQFRDRGFTVVGVMIDDNATRIGPDFVKEKLKVSYPVVLDNEGSTVEKEVGPVQGIPLLILLDKQGKVVKVFQGYTNKDVLENAIEAVVRGGTA